MVPLVPALILGFASFIASAFVILRIVIPVLPPHPLSKRVSPVAKFGTHTLRSLSPADKAHIWLASLDLVALVIFFWQIINESTAGPSGVALALDPGSAVRLWIGVTIRQTCLLFVASATLLHVRMAQSVSFGARQWMLWAPTTLLVTISTTIAGLLSATGTRTFFYGVTSYSITIAILSSISFGCLIRTLFAIKKNLAVVNETADSWLPVREVEEKPRPSFATEEIDAIRDGASWITSNASSCRNSMSTWSFTTHQTATTVTHHSRGFGSATASDMQIPPVPPLPSPYGPLSPVDSDPFRRDLPPLSTSQQNPRMGSQSSWLTSSQGSHTTMTSWSYPTSSLDGTIRHPSTQDYPTVYSPGPETGRTSTPAMAEMHALGGFGYAPAGMEVEKGLAALAAPPGTSIEISMLPAYGWSVTIWLPLCFSLPYFILLSQNSTPSTAVEMLFIFSVTLSSPLLALNLLVGSPIPVPVGLFDTPNNLPVDPNRPLIHGSLPMPKISQEYKRSTSSLSVTVVEGRRSGDVWLSKGDAVDGKGRLRRAIGMLSATPKLSVLPPEEDHDELDMPPVPFRDDSLPVHVNGTPQSDNSVQFGRFRADSRANTHSPAADESLAFASRIMVAQRHYSALAQTVHMAGARTSVGGARESLGANTLVSVASGATTGKRVSQSSHLRSRSVTSTNMPETPTGQERFNLSPPPSFPLPPTPPSVRAARLAMLAHKKSFSSGQNFSFGVVDDFNEIDAMTAGVLPLLVPGLTLGEDMKIKKGDYNPPGTYGKSKGRKAAKKFSEFGADFVPHEVHTTPVKGLQNLRRKQSGHKKNHFSLPSLNLAKGTMRSLASWSTEFRHGLENKVGHYTTLSSNDDAGRRNTALGVDTAASNLQSVEEEKEKSSKPLGRTMSTRSLGLRADVPHNIDAARSSVVSVSNMPPSAASTITLFEDFEAGLLSDPQGESTPHQSTLTQKPRQQRPSMREKRRSAIRYIKSDDQPQPATYFIDQTIPEAGVVPSVATPSSSQWSSRSIRPLVPQPTNRLPRNSSDAISSKEGLRTLTLVKKRESLIENTPDFATGTSSPSGIRPLTLGKRQKIRPVNKDENAIPGSTTATPRNKNYKELTLARSETSKMRGILRKTEVLPDVIVRPPSLSEHNSVTYSFRD